MTRFVASCLATFLTISAASLLAACGTSSTQAPADLSAASMTDLSSPRDLAAPADDLSAPLDLAEPGDLTAPPDLRKVDMTPVGECQQDGDCRLFSSYCSTAPCQCVPLPKGTPDPVCNGQIVPCFNDPCFQKAAGCVNNHCIVR